MSNSIRRAPYPGRGRCAVCGLWRMLEMWDDGLKGRFCSECFDYVVDAEECLVCQGLNPSGSVSSPIDQRLAAIFLENRE
jgi:hypothetical protein